MATSLIGDRAVIWLRGAVAAVLLTLIIVFVDGRAIVAVARDANGFWIAFAVALLPVNISLEAAKWRVLCLGTGRTCTVRDALGSILSGYSLGLITPARFGEYAGRVYYLTDPRKGSLLVLAMFDRLLSVWIYTLAGTTVLGLEFLGTLPGPRGVWMLTFALGFALTLVIGLLVLRPAYLGAIAHALLGRRLGRTWRRHIQVVKAVRPSTGLHALLLSSLRYAVFSSQFVCLVLAFSPDSAPAILYAGVMLVFFAKTVVPSISVFDLGVRESASVLILGFFGVASGAAFSAAMLLFAVNLVLPGLVGIALVPRIRWLRSRSTTRKAPAFGARTG